LTDRRGAQAFGYDNLDRLTSATHPLTLNQSFSYDAVGNRLTNSSQHNPGNQLTEDAGFTYTYDANGNLTRKTIKANGNHTDYTYDAENRLVKVEEFAAGATTPAATSTYRYDGLGRRIEKVGNGITRRYIYDGEDILLEYDGTNTLVARYTHGLGIDEPIAITRGSSTFFYHQDGLGSVTELTDSTGTTVKAYAYDAWGNLIEQTGTVANPYTYTGREVDAESGLYHYRARYYDPTIGRFITEDPLLTPLAPMAVGVRRKINASLWLLPGMVQMRSPASTQRLNQYVYVRDNPATFTDPSGFIDADKRPCGREIDRCIAETRNTPLGGCLGTAYGLYFGGEARSGFEGEALISNCKGGKLTRECLRKDQLQVIANCHTFGPFPDSCTIGVAKCIEEDPTFEGGGGC